MRDVATQMPGEIRRATLQQTGDERPAIAIAVISETQQL